MESDGWIFGSVVADGSAELLHYGRDGGKDEGECPLTNDGLAVGVAVVRGNTP